MPTRTAARGAEDGPRTLHLVCPTQKRPAPVVMAGIFFLAFLPASLRNVSSPEELPLPWLGVVCLFALALLGALYRSLVYRDELLVYRGEAPPAGAMLALAAGSIRSVGVVPAASPWSAEGKWDALGFGEGPIEIETDTHVYRFGVGLDPYMVDETVDRIAAFCGLPAR